MKIAEAYVEVRGDYTKFRSEMKKQGAGAAQDIQKAMHDVFATAAVAGGLAKTIGAASDLNETISKTGVIFGASGKAIEAWSQTSAKAMGLSRQAALDAAGTFAIFGKGAGLAGDDLVQFSEKLTGLASDLASFNNTSPEQAIEAIGAALRGEAEPIRQYGVLLDDASVKAQALSMGLYSGKGNIDQHARVLAVEAEILRQTSAAQGDFARTADGAANSQRIAKAEAENAAASMGSAFLPIYTKAVQVVTALARGFQELPGPLQSAVVGLAALVALAGPIKRVVDTAQALTKAIRAHSAAAAEDTAATQAQAAANAELAASEGVAAGASGLAAAALVGVVAAVGAGIIAYRAYEDHKEKVIALTNAYTAALKAEAQGTKDATLQVIAHELQQHGTIDAAQKAGLTVAQLASIIKGQSVPAYDQLNQQVTLYHNNLESGRGNIEDNRAAVRALEQQYGLTWDQLNNLVRGINTQRQAYADATTASLQQAEVERQLGIEQDKTADTAKKAATATDEVASAGLRNAATTVQLISAYQQWHQVSGLIPKSQEEIAAAVQEEAKRFAEAASAAAALLAKQNELENKALARVDAQRAYTKSLGEAATSLADYTKAVKQHGTTSKQANEQATQTADQLIATAQAFAKSKGAADGSKTSIDLQVKSLQAVAKTLAPNDPLRRQLDAYITALKKIPEDIESQLKLRITGPGVTADGDFIGIRVRIDGSSSMVGGANARLTGHPAGGTSNPGKVTDQLAAVSAQIEQLNAAKAVNDTNGATLAQNEIDRLDEVTKAMFDANQISLTDYERYLKARRDTMEANSLAALALTKQINDLEDQAAQDAADRQKQLDDAKAASHQATLDAQEAATKAYLDAVAKMFTDAENRQAANDASRKADKALAAVTQANNVVTWDAHDPKATAADRAQAQADLDKAKADAAQALLDRASANAVVGGAAKGTPAWAMAVRAALSADAANAPALAEEIAALLVGIPDFTGSSLLGGGPAAPATTTSGRSTGGTRRTLGADSGTTAVSDGPVGVVINLLTFGQLDRQSVGVLTDAIDAYRRSRS